MTGGLFCRDVFAAACRAFGLTGCRLRAGLLFQVAVRCGILVRLLPGPLWPGGRIDGGKIDLIDHFRSFEFGRFYPGDLRFCADGIRNGWRTYRRFFYDGSLFLYLLLYNRDLFLEKRLGLLLWLLSLFFLFLFCFQTSFWKVDCVRFYLRDLIPREFLLQRAIHVLRQL